PPRRQSRRSRRIDGQLTHRRTRLRDASERRWVAAGVVGRLANRRSRSRGGAVSAIPRATYRVQLNRAFGFRAARAIVPYLARLGISHLYTSPFLKARAGSLHGYDIVDHEALNPEIGTQEDFEA